MAAVSKKPNVQKPAAAVAVSKQVSVPSGPPCKGRSVKKLQSFMRYIGNDTSKINILLARALLNDDMLDSFDGYPHASECAFSYPDSDWYSVYLLDEDGNKVWDPEAGHAKLYFKIDVDGSDARIDEDSMTNDVPDELIDPNTGEEMQNCVVSGSSCTGTRPKVKAAAAVSKPSASRPVGRPSVVAKKAAASPVPVLVSPDILSGLETLTVAPAAGPSRTSAKGPEKITRDYFEEMKSKEVIVDWMVKNMSRADLVKCVEKGAVSESDIAQASALAESEPVMSGSGAGPSGSVPDVVLQAAETMPVSEFKKMLKKATKESIKESLPKDPTAKKNAIVDLCTRSGVAGYSVRENKKGNMKIYDPDDEPIDESDINDLLDTCAQSESVRLKAVIDKLRKRYAGSGLVYAARERGSASEVPEVNEATSAITLDSIIGQIMAIGSLDDKKNAILELCQRSGNPKGYSIKKNKKGVLKIYDADDEPIDDADIDDVLQECGSDELKRLNGFGKKRKSSSKRSRQQNKFKAAAKKCKGKPNFRKCMSAMLKKK